MWPRFTACLFLFFACVCDGFAEAPKKLLLLDQNPDGHPPQTHEYRAGTRVLAKCLKHAEGLEATIVHADGPWNNGPELVERADGIVLFLSEGARWLTRDPRRLDAFRKLASHRGGLVVLHWGMGTREAKPIPDILQLFGGCHGGPDRKYIETETDVHVADPRHPIVSGVNDFHARDEFYYRLKFVKPDDRVQPLLQISIDGRKETVAWAWQRPNGGRSFGFSGLHFHENWRHESYRRLVAQAVLWSLGLPIPAEGLAVPITPDDLKLE
jgi:type 1 glutamine amidotransferase